MCRDGDHSPARVARCYGAPVFIPCPVPRSVTFEVVLTTECLCLKTPRASGHRADCPARPVRVSCSISGRTWEDSAVEFVERADGECIGPMLDRVDTLVRDRWALIKALVLGSNSLHGPITDLPGFKLLAQRDAVFAALADMARAEQDACNAQQRVDEAFPFDRYRRNDPDHRSERPSIGRLAAYVEHLIRSVGGL